MNNLFQVGDQVVLNDVPLEPGDNHKLLKPDTQCRLCNPAHLHRC
jgi:hypothetical protein